MKPTVTRASYLPKGAVRSSLGDGCDSEIHYYTAASGRAGALVFHGKKVKPALHAHFTSIALRDRFIADHLAERRRIVAERAAYKAERAAPHALEPGAVLVSSWGYDQTNVNFYQVVQVVSPRMVVLCEIEQDREYTGDMTGRATPRKDVFAASAQPITKRADGTGTVKLSSYSFARPWDGKPKAWSSYA